jgi:hypothetical protein
VPSGSILEQFGIGTEKLLVPEPTTEPNLFPTLRSWNVSSQLRPHLDRTSSQSPGERSPVEKPSSSDFIFWYAKCTFQFQPASLPRSLSQQLHERLQGEAIPLDQVPKIDAPSEGFSSGSQMGTLGEAHNMISTSSRAPKTFLA